mmetsp:Transcript_25677/g.56502  ORF Transcript_25677/g.56502 Transcript_25677/m.56502 type:complete len:234 (+) Transcript_25677:157-858(+)|eukprot:CAMPEP_0201124054 /NCGR_PEP_ID=MMETSP0850-20130426/10320_1 /ASSEMBLY_ACC=CAM_ASM_000622 /TAXON_ID=183588 /ORGANISM="Pseudo-nitzschia fraudulenta, Strain WWA7" /LENGTH=233 /DNA_ID=CAMNT_0047391241 /DNA_START=111 /DNA_END=812 /DNA_ORIENTATION=-
MSTATPLSAGSSSSPTAESDFKISNDLVVLKEKMNLLETMLNPPDLAAPRLSVRTDEAVRSVIGYLDACGPRMVELVTTCTSATRSVLSEEVFGDVLDCNDRLQKLLADVDTRLLTETATSTTEARAAGEAAAAAASVVPSSTDLADQFGDLLLGDDNGSSNKNNNNNNEGDDLFGDGSASMPVAGAKTTGETSEDFRKAPPPAAAPPAPPPTTQSDPFDDFFAERTTTGGGF